METHGRFFTWRGGGGSDDDRQIQLDYPLNVIRVFIRFLFCLFQEVHDLLQDYELKYCYVDRNKRTGKISILSI